MQKKRWKESVTAIIKKYYNKNWGDIVATIREYYSSQKIFALDKHLNFI